MRASNKINYILWRAGSGGLERVTELLADHFRKEYDITIMSMRKVPYSEMVFSSAAYRVIFGPSVKLLLYPYLLLYFHRHRYEIFHLMNTGPLVAAIARLAGVRRAVYHIHGTVYGKTGFQRLFGKILWRNALSDRFRIIANSSYSREVFSNEAFPGCRADVIYNPVSAGSSEITRKRAVRVSNPEIFYVGRLSGEKNLFEWVRVASAIASKFPLITYHIYGTGPERMRLEAYSEEMGLKNRLFFEGYTDNPSEAYQKHDLLLFLSEKESFGNVPVESVISGTPVLVSPIPAMKELFADFPGLMLDESVPFSRSVPERLECIEELLVETKKAEQIFRDKFSPEKVFDAVKKIYNELQS